MSHLLTDTGDKNKMCVRQLGASFVLSGSGNGEYCNAVCQALHKAPGEFIQVVRVPPLRVCDMISHSCLDTLAIVGGQRLRKDGNPFQPRLH
ncbi:hypothetical protein BU55_25025 [Escherichia coli O146:H21 str. 2010C-3325]|nr:hypothetical protein BU55_25025 [Escherichia coli O146:H21 str. 2010C-3325]